MAMKCGECKTAHDVGLCQRDLYINYLKGLPKEVLVIHWNFLFALFLVDCVKKQRWNRPMQESCNADNPTS